MLIPHPVRFLDSRFEQIQRSRQLIARVLNLDNDEYRLWDLLCSIRPMPYKNEQTDIITATNIQLGQILGVSHSTVCRHRNSLASKNAIQQLTDSSSRILIGLEKTIPPILQEEVAKLREQIASLQTVPGLKIKRSNTSNKSSNLSVPSNDITLPSRRRNRSEYEETQREGNYQQLTIEDMMWIDSQHYD